MSFAYDSERSGPGCQTFTWVPGQEEREAGESGLAILNRLVSLIPEGTGYEEDRADYPHIPITLVKGSQVHYSMRRPVFSIAGVPFFRRYNDDYNPLVIQGRIVPGKVTVNWIPGGTTRASIARLLELVESHGLANVTEDQVLAAMRD